MKLRAVDSSGRNFVLLISFEFWHVLSTKGVETYACLTKATFNPLLQNKAF